MRFWISQWRRNWKAELTYVVFMGSVLLGVVGAVHAADGDLDPLWNSDGMLSLGAVDTIFEARGIAVLCDGGVVVAGTMNEAGEPEKGVVIRFTSFGYLDTTFATNGVFTVSSDFGDDMEIWDVLAQPDGKVVVVGARIDPLGLMGNAMVWRLTSDGVLDPDFGSSGVQYFAFGILSTDIMHGVALQSDGRIVVAGTTSGPSNAFAVARLNSAGWLDNTFSDDGKVIFQVSEGDDEGWDVAVQQDGRIVVAGTAVVGGGTKFAVVSLLPSGSPDTRFGPGGDGRLTFDFGDQSYGRALALQDDMKIVVAGSTDGSSAAMAVARVTDHGELDTLFSKDGKVVRDFGPGLDEGWDVALQADGRIIVGGNVNVDGLDHFALARFTTGGLVDNSFGGFGYSAVNYASPSLGRCVAIQPHDRKILLAGFIDTPPFDEKLLGVVRTIGADGIVWADGFESGSTSAWSNAVP